MSNTNNNNILQEQISNEIKQELNKWTILIEEMNNIKQKLKLMNVEKQDIEYKVLEKMKSFNIKTVDLENGGKVSLTKSSTKKALKQKELIEMCYDYFDEKLATTFLEKIESRREIIEKNVLKKTK